MRLLRHLHDIEFRYIIDRDQNQAAHGVNLRWKFAINHYDADYAIRITDDWDEPCSVLEMLVALAIRCEENIMDDPQFGDRTSQWFWKMIINLELGGMSDDSYDDVYVYHVVNRFLNREYSPDGRGGLFYIHDCDYDLRDVEITKQLYWYLDTLM
jgi:hypothetical protein